MAGCGAKIFYLLKDPTIKKGRKKLFTQPQIWIKNKFPPLAKNVTKEYHSTVTRVLHHFSDMSLITACAIFCGLNFHVVCTFFGDTICLLTNRKMIKIVTLIDWFAYCIDIIWLLILLFRLEYLSESCFGNYNNKMFITQPLSCFSFTQPFTHWKFC
jgi:hypothetical protein